MNYNMNKLNYTLPKLFNILVVSEDTLKSSKENVLSVEQASRSKRKSLGKRKKLTKKLKKERRKLLSISPQLTRKNASTVILQDTERGTVPLT